MKPIIVLFFTLLSIALSAQKTFYDNLTITMVYAITQEEQLNFIAQKYPSLKNEVDETRSLWKLAFGDAVPAIEKEIVSIVGNDDWKDIKEKSIQQVAELRDPNRSKSDAIAYLKHIREDRCKGKIESPILEMLLVYKPSFQENPSLEFTKGFIKPIKTQPLDKALGLKLEFNIPQSWQVKESEQPHVLFLFESGLATESASLQLNSVATMTGMSETELSNYSPKELADAFLTDEALSDIPTNVSNLVETKNLKTRRALINEYHTGIVSFTNTVKKKDLLLTQHQTNYFVLYKNQMIVCTFLVHKGKSESSESFEKRIDKFSLLYKNIMGSFIL